MQLALSDSSFTTDVRAIRAAQPGLPISGDRRVGVLAFDGERIVGSYVIVGTLATQGYQVAVDPEYRRHGLASRLLAEWYWATMAVRVWTRQAITPHAVKAALGAHAVTVERAALTGLPVPARVLTAVREGAEAAAIIADAYRKYAA